MKKFLPFVLGLLIVFIFFTSCIVAVVDYAESSAIRRVEEFRKVVHLDSGGTLSLENINGDIEIQGWDSDEVEIYAERRILRPYGRKFFWYSTGHPVPKIDVDEFEDFVKIKTRPSRRYKESSVVDYYLNVPHSINLKDVITKEGDIFISDFYGKASVDLMEGDVEVENFSGSLNVSVVEGSVKATMYDLQNEDEIKITTKQGDIIIYLQEDVNAKIEANTLNGDIFSEFDFKEPLLSKKISEQIGEDGVFLSLSSLNGDIRIKKL